MKKKRDIKGPSHCSKLPLKKVRSQEGGKKKIPMYRSIWNVYPLDYDKIAREAKAGKRGGKANEDSKVVHGST